MSTGTCLKLRVREPRGPVTVTTRDATSTFTVCAQDGRTRNSLSTGCKLGQDKAPMAAQDQRRSSAQCGRAGARLRGHAGGGSPPALMLSSRPIEVTFLMILILQELHARRQRQAQNGARLGGRMQAVPTRLRPKRGHAARLCRGTTLATEQGVRRGGQVQRLREEGGAYCQGGRGWRLLGSAVLRILTNFNSHLVKFFICSILPGSCRGC
eukprot:COSAG01_NODE_17958_length_1111_cov_3.431818_1_plen_211_part_00